jgi:pyruvate kinase
VARLRDELTARGAGALGLVVTIGTRQGFAGLPEILLDLLHWPRAGVMIAGADLAVEVGWERMAEVPDQMLAMCQAARVPTIWATRLPSLATRGQPSRAEITDAAAGERAECVMLEQGTNLVDAVGTLDRLLRRMVRVQRRGQFLLRPISSWTRR